MGIKRLIGSVFGEREPDLKHVLRRGINFFKQGDTNRALRCFEEIISKHTRCADAYYWKGWTLHSLGLHEEAIRQYDAAIGINPASKEVQFQKGNSLACLARFEEAIVCYALALDIDPGFAEALSNISVCTGVSAIIGKRLNVHRKRREQRGRTSPVFGVVGERGFPQ